MPEIEAEGTIYFAYELLGKPNSLVAGKTYEVNGVPLRYEGAIERRGIEAADLMRFVLETAAGTALVHFAKRCVELGRKHLKRLRVDGVEVPIEEENVLEILRQAQDLEDTNSG